jgi:L-asparagine transporter-like permease
MHRAARSGLQAAGHALAQPFLVPLEANGMPVNSCFFLFDRLYLQLCMWLWLCDSVYASSLLCACLPIFFNFLPIFVCDMDTERSNAGGE